MQTLFQMDRIIIERGVLMETIELTSSIWEKYVECPMGGTVIQGDYCGTNLFRAEQTPI